VTAFRPGTSPPEAPLSRRKRRWFTATVLALPVIVIVGTELTLRLVHYGGDQNLVLHSTVGGKECLVINRDVARRYFTGHVTGIPEPADDRFELVKGKRTKRIFCLGESTMQGFPYEYHATPSAFLRDRLQAMLPGYQIEVVNVGLSAVGSFVVGDFIEELSGYEPDLFLIYLGHNEFYGVYGVGSALGAGRAWMTRLAAYLLRFRSYLLLRDGYQWIREHVGPVESAPRGSLMGQMVGNRSIPYNGPLYREAREVYERNLHSIIATARNRGVPIMFSSLVSNIRDQKPFVSVFDEATGETQKRRWQSWMSRGDSLEAAGNHLPAVAAYGNAVNIDSVNASGFFALGKALMGAERFSEAKEALERARDLDALRFRASSDFQRLLLDVCRSEAVPVARADSAFEAASDHGIIGGDLILEHLHPNVDGYFLMARTWVEAVRREGYLVSHDVWANAPTPSDTALMASSTVSGFDRIAGRIKIELLMHRWPFAEQSGPVTFTPRDDVEALVYRYIRGQIPWSEARYALADLYASRGEFDEARNECRAVARVLPFSYQPLLHLAGYYRREGNVPRAKQAYRRSLEVEDNPFSRMKLAIISLEEAQPGPAAAEIEQALALVSAGRHRMTVEALAMARYLLGAAYAQMGRLSEARENLQRALAIKGDLAEARELLDQLNRQDAGPH
jgi:tetratricopeptide (TPR) repeat protein